MVAKIAVAAAIYAIDKPYSYRIPQKMTVLPGMRVMVPFGRSNRRTEGVVLSVEESGEGDLKPIERVLDVSPVLSEAHLRLAAFVRERYFCTFYEAVKAMLPAGLWFRVVDIIAVNRELDWRAEARRHPQALRILECLAAAGGQLEYAALRRQFADEAALQAELRYLAGKRLVTTQSEFFQKTGDKTARMAALACSSEEAMEYAAAKRRSAPKQYAALELLSAIGSGCCKEICYFTGCTMETLRRLESLGYVEFYEEPAFRRVEVESAPEEDLPLSEAQQQAFDRLCAQWSAEAPGAALLYGVTGSGKTAVYIHLIRRCLETERSAILLVPEIGLTPQLLRLLAAQFGDNVAVLHSGLRVGARYDEWKRIRDGLARVVVGTRSAVFAPTRALGLLIVDEEQEHTYKSENAPRYHAREVALFRGLKENALVVLGSATPSVETMYRAKQGDIALYELLHRYNGRRMPEVLVVDMRQELKAGNGTSISSRLRSKLERTIADGHQAILFLNRRGASRSLVCVDCGNVLQCPRCSVHMTYHMANHRLMCHYCGHSEPTPSQCPACGGHLKRVGTGTQKVVEELAQLFPGVEVLRMDADTVSAVNSHERLLSRFEQEKIPILLGTQMVTKGLNFENVTLVGVLDADMSLYVDSYRAAETTFSMITQVVGRSGRGLAEGTALLQTMTPENAVICLSAAQDYDRFYDMEIAMRQVRGCPPFQDLFSVTFLGPMEDWVVNGATRFRARLCAALQSEPWSGIRAVVLGPAPAAVAKVNNRYRYRVTLNCTNSKQVRQLLAGLLRDFAKDRRSKGVTAFVDVNPYD